MIIREQGWRRFQASFRRALNFTFWTLGFKQFSLCRIARVPRHAALDAWARLPVRWHAAVPFTSRIQASHQTHRHLLQSVPATRAIYQCASWRTLGFRQYSFNHIARVPQRPAPAHGHGRCFPAMLLFPSRFGSR